MSPRTDGGAGDSIARLANVLDEALALIPAPAATGETAGAITTVTPSLFEQCIALCQQVAQEEPPIRTLHHLSCTGGTLMTKCVAALPNVFVLNEVDPLSTMTFKAESPPFTPTDMLSLVKQANQQIAPDLLTELFLQNLALLHGRMASVGRRLVLRDHSHSHFLFGPEVPERATLMAMVARQFPVRSVVTVRDPVDSFLAVKKNGWTTFSPPSFDEYCRRYLCFLDAHSEVPCVLYEGFVEAPKRTMQTICDHLDLAYSDSFLDTFDLFRFSGDSGRSGSVIEARPRRPFDEGFRQEAGSSTFYRILTRRLGYHSIAD